MECYLVVKFVRSFGSTEPRQPCDPWYCISLTIINSQAATRSHHHKKYIIFPIFKTCYIPSQYGSHTESKLTFQRLTHCSDCRQRYCDHIHPTHFHLRDSHLSSRSMEYYD